MKTSYSQPLAPNPSPTPAGVSVYSSKDHSSNLLLWILISLGAHLTLVFTVWLVLVILQFFGWNIPLFSAKMKPREDIEFVLVDNSPREKPLKPTNRRAEHASRSGGKKVANKPTQMPQQAAGHQAPRSTPRPAQQQQPRPAQRQPTPARQQVAQHRPAQQPQPRPARQPAPPAPTPTPRPAAPTPKAPTPTKVAHASPSLPPNPIAPTIRTPAPPNPSVSAGGPIARTPGSSSGGGSPSGGSGSPGPSMIAGNPTRGGSGSAGMSGSPGGRSGGGGTGSYNQSGSPGGGGGRAGIDAMEEPDFGPYIAELQRRIRRNWAPPVEDRSKRVVALFNISRDGRLLSLRIQQSSGSPAADQAALAAVRASAPFRQLPPNYKGNDIAVQFIFDYEIYGHGSAKMR